MIETLEVASMATPHGRTAEFACRAGTTDWMTVNACCAEDEYHLPQGLSGWALDVGAHIGGVSVALLLDNPDLRVVALEGLVENAQLLAANVERNGLADRFLLMDGAAAHDHEPVSVFYGNTDTEFASMHRFIGNADWQEERKHDTRVGVTLEDVIGQVGPIRYVKIDCEGGEWGFLDSGAVSEVEEIVGEFHPRGGFGPARLHELLDATHRVEVDPALAFGPFRAVRR